MVSVSFPITTFIRDSTSSFGTNVVANELPLTSRFNLTSSANETNFFAEEEIEAAPIVRENILIAFNGATFPQSSNPLDSEGNEWFERIVRDAGSSLRKLTRSRDPIHTYRESPSGYRQAKADLFVRLDADRNGRISQQEADAKRIVIAGYSWGGIAAVNFSRQLTNNRFLRSSVDVQVEQLITLDPVRWGPFLLPGIFLKPLHGVVLQNVKNFSNYYQRGGTGTKLDLYLRGTTGNGNRIGFGSIFAGNLTFPRGIGGLGILDLVGSEIPANRVPEANRRQINVNTLGVLPPSNVEFWSDPADPRSDGPPLGTAFDGIATYSQVRHTALPFFVRGGDVDTFSFEPNVLAEIEDAFL